MEQKIDWRCDTLYKKECKPVPKSLGKTICEIVKNQQCRAIPVKQCHTTYSTISKTIQHRQCRKVEEQLCHRVPKEQCKTVNFKEQCHSIIKDMNKVAAFIQKAMEIASLDASYPTI